MAGQECGNEEEKRGRRNQEEKRTAGEMPGAEKIPEIEGYEASEGEESSQRLAVPSQEQSDTDADGEER